MTGVGGWKGGAICAWYWPGEGEGPDGLKGVEDCLMGASGGICWVEGRRVPSAGTADGVASEGSGPGGGESYEERRVSGGGRVVRRPKGTVACRRI